MHRHVGDELLYVIEGSISDESSTVSAGSVGYRPNGCVHSVTSKNGATVFAIITGGVEPANEIGTAPPSETIVLSNIPWIEGRVPVTRQKVFWSDPITKRRAVMARFERGAKLPRHKHIGDELLFMIEGSNQESCGPGTWPIFQVDAFIRSSARSATLRSRSSPARWKRCSKTAILR
jgi:anti-sigma factor ChrR (cupin superfamily)